ncbi:ABC transporter permease subunit [Nostoc sp. 2RC]|uniref:ABC transporter permease subunit n=1 Tax=Nostoc sp. 2RC TaxID=2485484 RepID=UPI0016262C10|nr:ABC transporter permease subunit [Nostoc sp. 2RC]MBC1238682.1 ABC transporter permease [Nostoc sp. 2RC]
MMLKLMDKIGDANPQLLRELKGRLKFFHVGLAVVISLLLQLVVYLYQLREFPDERYSLTGTYCLLRQIYEERQRGLYQQADQYKISEFHNFLSNNFCPENQIDWQLWWRDHWEYIFLSLSVIFIFTLLVAGTYLLINDLVKEERRGTLNFIRLSPQSETSILTGKLLGVPSFIYLIVLVAIPLHLWAGHSANIALSYIFSYYAIVIASCIFFYSGALLFGLVSRWLSGFQPWLGSGAVFFLLFMTMIIASSYGNSLNNSGAWLRLFNPWDVTNYLFPNLFRISNGSPLQNLEFFYIPLGTNVVSVVGLHLFNYGVCSYGIFKALKRCFRNPQASVINKGQSYIIVAFCQLMMWGFTLQYWNQVFDLDRQVRENFSLIALYNVGLLFSLIAILTPHRQTVQDWARYRHQASNKSIWWDLTTSEKSPALVAIAINLIIVSIPWLVWISLTSAFDIDQSPNWAGDNINRLKLLLALALFISMMLIYATIAQLILLLKTPKRSFWAIGTVSAVMFLPPAILEFIGMSSWKNPSIWLFSTFPWSGISYSEATTIFMAFLAQVSVLALLNFQLTKQVRLAGESATKALLAGR